MNVSFIVLQYGNSFTDNTNIGNSCFMVYTVHFMYKYNVHFMYTQRIMGGAHPKKPKKKNKKTKKKNQANLPILVERLFFFVFFLFFGIFWFFLGWHSNPKIKC